MEQDLFWHESEGHMMMMAQRIGLTAVAVARQVTVVLPLVMAVTHCIIAPKNLLSE
jgi:hypothetical protein